MSIGRRTKGNAPRRVTLTKTREPLPGDGFRSWYGFPAWPTAGCGHFTAGGEIGRLVSGYSSPPNEAPNHKASCHRGVTLTWPGHCGSRDSPSRAPVPSL
jgi:hypothetical protein